MQQYLNRPFPTADSSNSKIFVSLFFGFFIFTFLYIFRPFGISNNNEYALLISLGFGFITLLIVGVNQLIISLFFPHFFDPDQSKIKHNYIVSIWSLLSISIFNWLYSKYILQDMIHQYSLWDFILITFAVGIIPIFVSIVIFEKKLSKANQTLAEDTNSIILQRKSGPVSDFITLQSELKSENLSLSISDLIAIKAEGNYCEIYYFKQGKFTPQLMRISLKSLEKILEVYPQFMRCHRSYLVNLKLVSKVSGSARNISLHIDNVDFSIPVSRTNEAIVTRAIRHMI